MRKILFRGKRISNEKWVCGGITQLKHPNFTNTPYVICANNKDYFVDEDTIGQYTGFKDKNGTEIFEGDIVNCKSHNIVGIISFGNIYVPDKMEATHTGFFINWLSNTENDWHNHLRSDLNFWIKHNELQVIGNIHDNPELLESEAE